MADYLYNSQNTGISQDIGYSLFFQIHFQREGQYSSLIQFACRQPGYHMKNQKKTWTDENGEKKEYIKSVRVENHPSDIHWCKDTDASRFIECAGSYRLKRDYYLTKNTFTRPHGRTNGNLFTFHNIVIDIDAHKCGDDYYIKQELDILTRYLASDACLDFYGVPCPNTIVHTGRGMQLWYALNPFSYRLRYAYDELTGQIIGKVKNMLKELEITDLTLDPVACRNAAGLCRMPGTYNTKAKKYGSYIICHDQRLSLDAFFNLDPYDRVTGQCGKWNEIAEKREGQRKTTKTTEKSHKSQTSGTIKTSQKVGRKTKIERSAVNTCNPRQLAEGRTNRLQQLIRYRQEKGISMVGCRELICFLVYNIFCTCGLSERAEAMAEQTNALFSLPLSNGELQQAFGKAYSYKNDTIIEMLGITDEERKVIGFNRTGERVLRREEKAARNEQILTLFQGGLSYRAIAKAVKCSIGTVHNVLKRMTEVLEDAAETVETAAETAETKKEEKETPKKDRKYRPARKKKQAFVPVYEKHFSDIEVTDELLRMAHELFAQSSDGKDDLPSEENRSLWADAGPFFPCSKNAYMMGVT